MTSKQTTEKAIALIKGGMRSTDIAITLRISLPTVQGIKSQLTMKERTPAKSNIQPMKKITHSTEDSVEKEKSEAIINGYFLAETISSPSPEDLMASLSDFSLLIAQLTSTSKLVRDSAKQAVREFVSNHEKANSASLNKASITELTSDQTKTNRGKRWTQEEQQTLIKAWNDLHSARDVMRVRQIAKEHDRTELAIISRLFQASLVTMAQADELCVASNTPILISETFTPSVSSSKNDIFLKKEHGAPPSVQDVKIKPGRNSEEIRLCVECFQSIPKARLLASPFSYYCTKCLSRLEKRIDYHQYIDEGLAGTREEHKKIYGQDWE